MAEIASDARMSAANLYRYFASKQDIAECCCDRWMQVRLEGLRGVVRGPGSAAERLHAFVLADLRFTQEMACGQPSAYEMVEMVMQERPEFVHRKIEAVESLLSEILAYGNQTGEFDIVDIVRAARSVHAAILLYEVPIFANLFSLEEFEASAGDVVSLVLDGLRTRDVRT